MFKSLFVGEGFLRMLALCCGQWISLRQFQGNSSSRPCGVEALYSGSAAAILTTLIGAFLCQYHGGNR